MSRLSPNTRVGGSSVASAYNLAMISGPMPHASPIVIAIGKCSRLGILFHFHERISNGSFAPKPAGFCYQRQGLLAQDSQDRYTSFHLSQDFKGLCSQHIA